MKDLENDWMLNGIADFEYKKYMLLAYLQFVQQSFKDLKLYPALSDLANHYQNVVNLKTNKSIIDESFPKSLLSIDEINLKLKYRAVIEDDEVMKHIEEVVDYAIPRFKEAITEGKEVYDYVESNFEISSIGLSPLYKLEGYLFIDSTGTKKANIYQYKVTVFEQADEKYRGLNIKYIESLKKSLFQTYEQKKIELTRKFKSLPNPATYLVTSKFNYPYESTMMPIAKRLLVRYISSDSGSA